MAVLHYKEPYSENLNECMLLEDPCYMSSIVKNLEVVFIILCPNTEPALLLKSEVSSTNTILT